MLYDIKWLSHENTPLIINLSKEIYGSSGETYGPNLGPNGGLLGQFLLPEHIIGSNYRRAIGVFDKSGTLMMAIGVRQLQGKPSWLLSWMLSKYKNAKFMAVFRQALTFICDYFESINCNEFYVVHPAEKEEAYRYIIKFMREKYWTFVELTIPKHIKTEYSFYWSLTGYQLYQYDIKIRRYILKRPQDD